MRLIDRYICREVLSHALIGLAVFTFIFFVPQLVRLMSLVVRHLGDTGRVLLLFACSLPGVLTFTLPIAVLIGVLIGLGRLSADSEIIALSSLAIGRRRLLIPVGALALGTGAVTLGMTLWLGPAALREFHQVEAELLASQASFEVQPRVFAEEFPRLVLYAQDVAAAGTQWRGVFLAETDQTGTLQLTLAKEAIVIAEPGEGKLQLHLGSGSTHTYDPREANRYSVTTFGSSDLPVEVRGQAIRPRAPTSAERSIAQLLAEHGPRWLEARVELHRRFAFPAACLIFAMLAVPIGARQRRSSRALGFILTLLLICGYYLLFVIGIGKARTGTLPPWLGVWLANIVFLLLAVFLLARIDTAPGKGRLLHWMETLAAWRQKPQPAADMIQNGPLTVAAAPASSRLRRVAGFPLLIDLYALRSFLFFFLLMLISFVLLFEAFTFFELLEDMTRHHVPALIVANYFRYLAPLMFYELAPLAALVATLATLGVMSKNNEITALKASGVSLFRAALPLLLAGVALAAGMFLLDDGFLPYANQRQDALRNQIKGRPPQTYYQPRLRWIFGEGAKIYNYELFDPDNNLFAGLNVFELDPQAFQIRRRVYATRARWEQSLHTWVLERGWVRDFDGSSITHYVPFMAYTLAELSETPSYFKRQVPQSSQMNWRELGEYIGQLQQAGFDVARLSVQWHKKFAFPLIAPIIVLLGIPFAFLVGTRGAVGGLALAVAIGIVYWNVAALFEAMGALGQLPPLLAGWAPDAIFGFVGLYFFLKMQT